MGQVLGALISIGACSLASIEALLPACRSGAVEDFGLEEADAAALYDKVLAAARASS